MVNVTGLPTAVYLNEPVISSRTRYLDRGDVEHIIEEYSSTEETTTGGGVNIYQVLEFYREKTSGERESVTKKVTRDAVGNFAVYHGLLEEDDALQDLTGVDHPLRESLSDDGFIRATGTIRRSPFGEFLAFFEGHGEYMDMELSRDGPAYQQIAGAAEYFEMPMKNLDGSFMFTLNDDGFQDVDPEFPDEYQEYTVLGEIRHVYDRGEKKHHMDLLDLDVEKGMSHEERNELDHKRRSLERLLKDGGTLFGRSWSADDYHVSYPDIEIKPIAVYW